MRKTYTPEQKIARQMDKDVTTLNNAANELYAEWIKVDRIWLGEKDAPSVVFNPRVLASIREDLLRVLANLESDGVKKMTVA